MTEREIKLELAKVALTNGVSIETAKTFYEWIIEEPEHELPDGNPTKWDGTPIEELACRTKIKGTIIRRCKDNGINTVGDLIRCGGRRFLTYRDVGKGAVRWIDDTLEMYYDVKEWYKM